MNKIDTPLNCPERSTILLVDDRPENLLVLESILDNADVELVKSLSGNEALSLVLERDFALVLLDVQMPEMDGFEVAELMRKHPKTKHIPIIFISAISRDKKHIFKGYETGAVDYLLKPIDADILLGKVRVFCELDVQRKVIQNQLREITILNEQLRYAATHDALTGLLNRRAIVNLLDKEINRARRNNFVISVIMVDLDHFKKVNDTCGHTAGDCVLKHVASILCSSNRNYDTTARYGGEEFLIVVPECARSNTFTLAERIRLDIAAKPAVFLDHEIPLSASFGIADSEVVTELTSDRLVHCADQALYEAKNGGRNRSVIYDHLQT